MNDQTLKEELKEIRKKNLLLLVKKIIMGSFVILCIGTTIYGILFIVMILM